MGKVLFNPPSKEQKEKEKKEKEKKDKEKSRRNN
jgi:hypothetical protein